MNIEVNAVPPSSLSAAIKAAKLEAGAVYNAAVREYRGKHIAYREAEIIGSDGKGNRIGDADYVPFSKLSAGYLKAAIQYFVERGAAEVWLSGGFDLYESFGEYIQSQSGRADYDYEPRVEGWDYQIPDALVRACIVR